MTWFTIEMWLIALAATIALIAGFSMFARWCIASPAVPKRKLDALRVGMQQAEIENLLGKPRETRPGENQHRFWLYGSKFKRHLLVIELNEQRTLTEFVHGVPRTKGAGKNRDE